MKEFVDIKLPLALLNCRSMQCASSCFPSYVTSLSQMVSFELMRIHNDLAVTRLLHGKKLIL